jgi:hypothetical protein
MQQMNECETKVYIFGKLTAQQILTFGNFPSFVLFQPKPHSRQVDNGKETLRLVVP